MTLNGAIKQLHELRCDEDVPVYLKPAIAEVINTLLMDAQEVRHEKWIDRYNDGDWHCSGCGAIVEKDEQNRHNWYRCYHCGANMDEVE